MGRRQPNHNRNEMAKRIAASRKGEEHLGMFTPEHVKRAAKPVLTDEYLAEREALRIKCEEKKALDDAYERSLKSFMQHLQAPTPFQMASFVNSAMRPMPSSFLASLLGVDVEALPSLSVNLARLESLKAVTPQKIERATERPMPDYVEVITGWRAWAVQNTGEGHRLKSLGQNDIWEPLQQKNATCLARPSFASPLFFVDDLKGSFHAAPEYNCSCGIWAFKDLDTLVAALAAYDDIKVLGQVSLWGKVVETENGWRAEHGYPSELYLLQPGLEDLSWIYNVPVRTGE